MCKNGSTRYFKPGELCFHRIPMACVVRANVKYFA